MLFGLGAAGTGIDPVTGGTITCDTGDTFDPGTAMCYDAAVGIGQNEYAGVLTLPPVPQSALSTAVGVSAAPAVCPVGSTCTYIPGVPDTFVYLALAGLAYMMFKGGGGHP